MVNVLGLDIGGANTKYILINEFEEILTINSDYFPFWQKNEDYPQYLHTLKNKLTEKFGVIDYVAYVTTAELADCFDTKEEGIKEISTMVLNEFDECKNELVIYSVRDLFIPSSVANTKWLDVAASNWAVSAKYLSLTYPNAILIDIGSTTTDIIPIIEGKIASKGKNDFERLINNELIYTGLLRTNIATIIHELKLGEFNIPVASELFATTGDIYLVLGDIKESEFTVETANGKPAALGQAYARIAKVVCADMNQISTKDIYQIAKQVKEAQLKQINKKFKLILSWYRLKVKMDPIIILAGTGAKKISIEIMKKNKIDNYVLLSDILTDEISSILPAYAIAIVYLRFYINKEKKRERDYN